MSQSGDKRALLLGAGASRASLFKLPTMAGFFSRELSEYAELNVFLKSFYGDRDVKAYNLEEVLGHLHLSRLRQQAWEPDPICGAGSQPAVLYEMCIAFARSKLAIKPGAIDPLHDSLFSSLDPQDTILSV